jgi:YesN/AraC family two-component response regulator
LIVDDEKAVRTPLGRLLATRKVAGCRRNTDGATAIGMARVAPDIVIVDITMRE